MTYVFIDISQGEMNEVRTFRELLLLISNNNFWVVTILLHFSNKIVFLI